MSLKKVWLIVIIIFGTSLGWFLFNTYPYYRLQKNVQAKMDQLNQFNNEQKVLIDKILPKIQEEETVKHLIRLQVLYADYTFENYAEEKEIFESLTDFKEQMFDWLARTSHTPEDFFKCQQFLLNEREMQDIHDSIYEEKIKSL